MIGEGPSAKVNRVVKNMYLSCNYGKKPKLNVLGPIWQIIRGVRMVTSSRVLVDVRRKRRGSD